VRAKPDGRTDGHWNLGKAARPRRRRDRMKMLFVGGSGSSIDRQAKGLNYFKD
jgi:hypothetical protein